MNFTRDPQAQKTKVAIEEWENLIARKWVDQSAVIFDGQLKENVNW